MLEPPFQAGLRLSLRGQQTAYTYGHTIRFTEVENGESSITSFGFSQSVFTAEPFHIYFIISLSVYYTLFQQILTHMG